MPCMQSTPRVSRGQPMPSLTVSVTGRLCFLRILCHMLCETQCWIDPNPPLFIIENHSFLRGGVEVNSRYLPSIVHFSSMVATNKFNCQCHAITPRASSRSTIANCHRAFMFFAHPLFDICYARENWTVRVPTFLNNSDFKLCVTIININI